MDGLLIDTEDIYTLCQNLILREYGRPDIPWSVKAQLQGRPAPAATPIFFNWAKLPISQEEFYAKQSHLQQIHFKTTKPLPGVSELLSNLTKTANPHVEIALASSTHRANFKVKTDHLQDLFSVFPPDRRILGDSPRIAAGKGKPAPDIFLLALESINEGLKRDGGGRKAIVPEECLVFEDSVPGVEAGRRAGMRVVWVPHEGLIKEYAGREKEVLAGLTPWFDSSEGKTALGGEVGTVDDGWAERLESLENFPYEHYKINVDAN